MMGAQSSSATHLPRTVAHELHMHSVSGTSERQTGDVRARSDGRPFVSDLKTAGRRL
jgi:hypothetical protein